MTDNKNIFTNNKKSDNQNVKDNLLIMYTNFQIVTRIEKKNFLEVWKV